jgi:hypothetical protein
MRPRLTVPSHCSDLRVERGTQTGDVEAAIRPQHRHRWALALRVAIIGLGLLAGALLLERGNTVFGAVIITAAGLRLVLLVTMTRRRRYLYAAFGGASAPGAAPIGPLRALAPDAFRTAAAKLGVEPAELRGSFSQGRSIAELAVDRHVPVDSVVDAIVSDTRARIDRAVSEGRMPAADGDRAKGNAPHWASRLVITRSGS